MDHITQYALSEIERNKRIQEFTSVTDPEDLRAELGAARLLAHEALEEGNIAQADKLLTTIAKLAQATLDYKKTRGELLDRASVNKITQQLCAIVIEELQGIEGHEEIIDRIADRIGAVEDTK